MRCNKTGFHVSFRFQDPLKSDADSWRAQPDSQFFYPGAIFKASLSSSKSDLTHLRHGSCHLLVGDDLCLRGNLLHPRHYQFWNKYKLVFNKCTIMIVVLTTLRFHKIILNGRGHVFCVCFDFSRPFFTLWLFHNPAVHNHNPKLLVWLLPIRSIL